MKNLIGSLTKAELILWMTSLLLITLFFVLFDKQNYLALLSSLIGATSLIFCAKGHPIGQVMIIIFSMIYGYISYTFSYFGEMLTYVCMTLPMAVLSLIEWVRNPFKKGEPEVKVNKISKKEIPFICIITLVVTLIFYFVLKYFNTANLMPSTLSVTTSFVAVYLTFRRSPYYALAYAANDVVLIILWILASINDISYISVVVCFVVFLINDIYGFFNWLRMQNFQQQQTNNNY